MVAAVRADHGARAAVGARAARHQARRRDSRGTHRDVDGAPGCRAGRTSHSARALDYRFWEAGVIRS